MVRALTVISRALVSALVAAALLASGCDNLSDFNDTFTGSIIQGSFVRSCFASDLSAELRFDPALAVGSSAGLPDEKRNWLTLLNSDRELVLSAPLDPIDSLSSDTLADFDFPGQKRLRSYMLWARPTEGPLAGRDALVVVSLLATKRVELRVMARGAEDDPACASEPADPDAGAEEEEPRVSDYYGLFKLK